MGATILVETGWPAAILSPNGRPGHPRQLARAKRVALNEGYVATYAARPRDWAPGAGRFNVTIHAHPKVTRTRDADNLIGAAKAFQDGIARALGVDDSRFNAPAVVFHAANKRRPKLVFQIEAAPC